MSRNYLNYLKPGEIEQVRILENNIRHAKTVDEVEHYRTQLGLIMNKMVIRYQKDYRKKHMKKEVLPTQYEDQKVNV